MKIAFTDRYLRLTLNKKDKMKTTFNFFGLIGILVIIIIVGVKCEGWPPDRSYTVDLVNNSGHNIGYYFATGGRYGTCYPDSLPETNEYIMYDISKVYHLAWKAI